MLKNKFIILSGALFGLFSSLLVVFGNPMNMGLCIACFLRDISGAIGIHNAGVVQYIRPEISGLILGSLIASVAFKEFKSVGGSSPVIRFTLGAGVMIGALVFLGCPLRMILRLAGGDLNAVVGLLGFAVGIGVGIFCLNKGFSLHRNYKQSKAEGSIISFVAIGLMVLLLLAPAFIRFSTEGPGSMTAPIGIALGFGLFAGFVAQRTRLCMVGGIRDVIMFKDFHLISGFVAILVTATIANLAFGNFNLGFAGQPIAHTDGLWNFLGMIVVGWGSVLLGGCPLRQLILAGEGNSDSTVTVLGLMVGAGFAHNFGLASSPAGSTANGQISVIILLVIFGAISIANRRTA